MLRALLILLSQGLSVGCCSMKRLGVLLLPSGCVYITYTHASPLQGYPQHLINR